MQYVTLANQVKMPQLGFGVYQINKKICKACVLDALHLGYRLLDTAQSYANAEEVGKAIMESGVKREEIFITSKVWIDNYGYEKCMKSVIESLRKLQTSYIDLMLLHQSLADYYGAYKALENLYSQGLIKAIGVSNFSSDRLVDLCSFSRIKPMVNQVEVHPFNQQTEAKKWMDKYEVQMEAWAPLAEGKDSLFTNEVIARIALKHKKTPAQVLLRWNLDRGVIVIPKSTHKERMKENISVFDFSLDEEDMSFISTLDRKKSSFFSHHDPKIVEWLANYKRK